MFVFVLILASEKKKKKEEEKKRKRMFGYSVKVFSDPDWKLPRHSETGQVLGGICFSVNKQQALGLDINSCGSSGAHGPISVFGKD